MKMLTYKCNVCQKFMAIPFRGKPLCGEVTTGPEMIKWHCYNCDELRMFIFESISPAQSASEQPNSGGTGESLAAEPPSPLEQD